MKKLHECQNLGELILYLAMRSFIIEFSNEKESRTLVIEIQGHSGTKKARNKLNVAYLENVAFPSDAIFFEVKKMAMEIFEKPKNNTDQWH